MGVYDTIFAFIVELCLDNLGHRKELLKLVNLLASRFMLCQLFIIMIHFPIINITDILKDT